MLIWNSITISKNNPLMNKRTIVPQFLLACLVLVGCNDDWTEKNGDQDAHTVSFRLQTSALKTRSAMEKPSARKFTYDLHQTSPEGEPLVLVETITSIDEEECAGSTRGVVVTTDNFPDNFGTDGFLGKAYTVEDGTAYPFPNTASSTVRFTKNGDVWSHTYSGLGWPSDDGMVFILYASHQTSGIDNIDYHPSAEGNSQITFDFTSPSAAGDMQDVLFTATTMKPGGQKTKSIHFDHTLTAIQFKDGYKDAVSPNIFIDVEFKNLKTKGSCTMSVNPENEQPLADNGITWSSVNTPTTYSMTFSGSSTSEGEKWQSADAQTLWVIPQSADAGSPITMTIKYKFGTDGDEREATITLDPSNWKAGERHVFSINPVSSKPAVTVTKSDDNKFGATVQNNGNYAVYMRAAIVPYWSDGTSGSYLNVPWSDDTNLDAKLYKVNENFCWVKGNDGFYYYKGNVDGVGTGKAKNMNNPIPILIDYVQPTAPKTGAELIMDVAVQTIVASEITSAAALTALGWENHVGLQ